MGAANRAERRREEVACFMNMVMRLFRMLEGRRKGMWREVVVVEGDSQKSARGRERQRRWPSQSSERFSRRGFPEYEGHVHFRTFRPCSIVLIHATT